MKAKPTQPEYSEHGPVFVAQSYETTDECAPESRTTWRVQDLDDHVVASDCSQQDAEAIARSLNCHFPLLEAAKHAARVLESMKREDLALFAQLEAAIAKAEGRAL